MVYGVFAFKLFCTSRYPKKFFIDLHMQVYVGCAIIKCQKPFYTIY